MIVWSKGLGKQTLPMELEQATLRVAPDHLAMDGLIESVYWNYTMRLYPDDLGNFMKVLADPKTAWFLAGQRGILLPFILKLCVFIPKLSLSLLKERTIGKLRRRKD
jgi:hypothetical protein